MCEFVSWVEKGKKVYFLTTPLIESEKGSVLLKNCREDIAGHGAIRLFYGLEQDEGTNKECVDFSSPANFPAAIVEAIKSGEMRGLGTPEGLLTPKAWAQYLVVKQTAWAQYEAVEQTAWAQYLVVKPPALAQYKAVERTAWAQYKAVEQTAFWDLFADPQNRAEVWK